MSDPTISVIIPVLNEITALPTTLPALLAHRDFSECLLVDGGSTDGTVACIGTLEDPRLRLLMADRGRAIQLNAGAREATGDCLVFHHADTLLPENAFPPIRASSNRLASGERSAR